MSTVQETFVQGHPERGRDGAIMFVSEGSYVGIGRLSSKEVTSTVTLVVTEKAMYEFKGSTTKGKETKRYTWEDVSAVVIGVEKENRFILCISDSSYRTYEMFTVTARRSFTDAMKARCSALRVPFIELPEVQIARVLKASKRASSKVNVWADLLTGGVDLSEPGSSTADFKVNAVKRGTDLDSAGISANLTAGSSAGGGVERVGGLGNIGPMTLIWRRLEAAIQPHLNIATDDRNALEAVERLKSSLRSENSPFSLLGAPKDSAQAMIALASLMMDNNACANLAKLFAQSKASSFLGALEANLGCGECVVRRWTALSLMVGLPVFAESSTFPNTEGWYQATTEYSGQVRRRENAVMRLLFPPPVSDKRRASNEGEGDGSEYLLGPAKDEKNEKTKSFGKLRVLTKSDGKGQLTVDRKPSSLMPERKPSSLMAEGKRPARLSVNFMSMVAGSSSEGGGAAGGGDDAFPLEPSDRKIRGALALMWASRLLDLESSVKEEGIKKSDVQTMFQLLLGKYPDPNAGDETTRNTEFEVETFGATVESPEFFPSIISSLTATRNDDVRCGGLKQINVLVMRNAPAIKSFLMIPDWQSVVLASLYNVPFHPSKRDAMQEDAYSYSMHLATTLHLAVLGSRSAASEFGPIDKLLGQTIYKIAVYSGWGDPAIHVTRSIFKGIFSTLAKQASMPTCTWKHHPMNDEWEELFRLSHLLQTFLFYRPVNMGLKDVPVLIADASIKAAKGLELGEFSDWRARISHQPLLNRVQNERLIGAHRQMYAKLGLPVMTAAHRGDETGIHLDEFGLCHDRSLVETAIKLWNTLGVVGVQKDDQKKSEEHMNKADRSRIMYASNVCRELVEVLKLFDVVDEKRAQVLNSKAGVRKKPMVSASPRIESSRNLMSTPGKSIKKTPIPEDGSSVLPSSPMEAAQRDQVQAIAQSKATDFLEKQKKKETNVGFLTKAKTKNQAINLRSNMLQKREVAIRKLGSGSDKIKPQIAATSTLSVSSSGRSVPAPSVAETVTIQIRANDVVAPPAAQNHSPIKGPNEDEEKSIFEKEANLERRDGTTIVQASRRTLVKLRKTQAQTQKNDESLNAIDEITTASAPDLEDVAEKKHSLIVSRRKRSRAPMCHGCDRPIHDEVNEVSKFGHFWHGECLVCSNCHCNILTSGGQVNPLTGLMIGRDLLEICRYYPLPELLVCSKQCRDAVLSREGDARCPGCMDGFNKNEKTILACGYSWHVDSHCFRCVSCDVKFDDNTHYFEVQDSPYCQSCLDTKFLHCKVCAQPLLDTDKVVEANDCQYHETCFACSVCHELFKEDNFFRGEHGELFCFNHYLQKRTPPCASCHLPFSHKREESDGVDDPTTISGLTFHRGCFKCSKCSRKLLADAKPGTDEEPNEHGGSLFCPDCYGEEFGIKCRACSKGVRGDILHAGAGKHGETINWHPSCFVCDECKCPLLDQPFLLVSVGDDLLVPVCFDHYQKRYGNRKCPGCDSFVSPNRGNGTIPTPEPNEMDTEFGKKNNRQSAAMSSVAPPDNNPAVMFSDAMWHARCLLCDADGCGTSLYEEQAVMGSNTFKIETVGGRKFCMEHFESHLDPCFTCKKGIREQEPRANLMGWSFHDTPLCFQCVKCNGPIEPGQALLKLEEGPAHQACPSKRKTGIWAKIKGS